jgi:hypothetical protein
VPYPFASTKDVFALRDYRVANTYRKISINNLKLDVSGVPIRERVYLRIVPYKKTELAFWYNKQSVGV